MDPSPDCGQVKRPFSNLLAQTQSPVPSHTRDLQPIALGVAEQEQVPAQRLTRQSVSDEAVEPLEPLNPSLRISVAPAAAARIQLLSLI